MATHYVAFFSYTRADDDFDHGLLTKVRERLESSLRLALGRRDIEIFQDRDDIEPGDAWEARLQKAIDEAVFLIPVITPSFFASEFCRKEFLRFWEKAQADPNTARIIPLYWREHFPLEGIIRLAEDDMLSAVKALQYDDWRSARRAGLAASQMSDKIEEMSRRLAIKYMAGLHDSDTAALPANKPGIDATLQPTALPTPEREGRIKVNVRTIQATSEVAKSGWLLPGNGREEWFQDHPLGPQMVVVPAGEYVMGGPPGEEGRQDNEGPQHPVAIAEPFAVGRFAVTVGEFTTFVEATGHNMLDEMYTFEEDKVELRKGRSFRNPGFSQTAHHPVVGVSWDDATAYCKWLTVQSGKVYRLLSEAEWEYCCRAGTSTPFWWGKEISTTQANYNGNYTYGNGAKGEYRQKTVPVDNFEPNPWGFFQMYGNVWEWCADTWHENYRDAPQDGSAWEGGDTPRRVVRGGSWDYIPQILRSANRFWIQPGYRNDDVGFRVSRMLTL